MGLDLGFGAETGTGTEAAVAVAATVTAKVEDVGGFEADGAAPLDLGPHHVLGLRDLFRQKTARRVADLRTQDALAPDQLLVRGAVEIGEARTQGTRPRTFGACLRAGEPVLKETNEFLKLCY